MPWTKRKVLRMTKEYERKRDEWYDLPRVLRATTPSPTYERETITLPYREWIKTRRWVNDMGRTRVTYSRAKELIEWYREAREYGYNQRLSRQYAVFKAERSWHCGDQHILLEGPKKKGSQWAWQKNTRGLNCSKSRFLRVLSNTVHGEITVKDLESKEDPSKILWGRLSKAETRSYKRCLVSVKNYITVCGLPDDVTEEKVAWVHLCFGKIRDAWQQVSRGRDLFKLWRFNIPEVIQRAHAHVYTYPGGKEALTPTIIMSVAYQTGEYYLHSILNRPYALQYVLRWQDWWKQLNHMRRLDELPESNFEIRDNMTVHPTRLLQARRWGQCGETRDYNLDPPYEVAKEVEELINCKYKLRPVVDYKDLVKVSQELHNCARNYHTRLNDGRCLLVVMETIDNSKPVALGEITRHLTVSLRRMKPEIAQLTGPCNQQVDQDTRNLYNRYLKEKLNDSRI